MEILTLVMINYISLNNENVQGICGSPWARVGRIKPDESKEVTVHPREVSRIPHLGAVVGQDYMYVPPKYADALDSHVVHHKTHYCQL